MKKKKLALIISLPLIAIILLFIITADGNLFNLQQQTLTIGSSEKLELPFPINLFNNAAWASSDPAIASVDQNGIVTANNFYDPSSGAGSAVISAKAAALKKRFIVNTTMEGQIDIMTLPPMMDQFSNYFLIGNIFNPYDTNETEVINGQLKRHYNALTAENDMKPDKLAPSPASINTVTADRMVDAALASGFKVVGHTLLWHSQIPGWQAALRTNNTPAQEALQLMKEYVTNIVSHFKGRIFTWDVLNEAFPDDGYSADSDWRDVMRKDANGNPWYMKIGPDFVYEGFLAARLADSEAVLYYNDYNLDQQAKAAMVRDMVRDINEQYRREYPGESRLLIEGIGMQSHHNTEVAPANVRNSINMFRELGVRISISELDVLSQSWNDYSPNRNPPNNFGKLRAASLYGEFFRIFLDNADIIERVTFWGINDEQSWRKTALPLLFQNGLAKPAYYKVISALKNSQ